MNTYWYENLSWPGVSYDHDMQEREKLNSGQRPVIDGYHGSRSIQS